MNLANGGSNSTSFADVAFSFCSIPSAGIAHQPSPQHRPEQLGQASPQLVSGTRTPGAGGPPDAAGLGLSARLSGIVFATIFQ